MRVQGLRIRPATADDSALLLAWRNDAATRASALAQAEVAPAEHEAWLAGKLADPRCRMYIGEASGRPVGQVRFDFDNGVAEIDITVAPEARGRGFAVPLLRMACRASGAARLVAHVRPENARSLRVFEKAGFHRAGSDRIGGVALARMERRETPRSDVRPPGAARG